MNTIKLSFSSDSWFANSALPVITIFGVMYYKVGYEDVSERVEIEVANDFNGFEIFHAFEDLCAEHILRQGGRDGFVRFRNDGSNRKRSIKEWIRDTRYSLTKKGTPVTRVHIFVPKSRLQLPESI